MQDRLFRALAIARVVVTLNMVGLNAYRRDNYEHATAGLVIVTALVGWTALAIWLYASATRRTAGLLVVDLAVAVVAMGLTPIVKTEAFNATIPGFWVMGALLAWSIQWHWKGGLVAGVVLSATDLFSRQSIDQGNYGNVFLMMIGGPIIGYMCASLQRMAAERDAAERAMAAAEERARLARAVHDGVLQVLALVQRRGLVAGGEFTELANLAGEQERSLRTLIRQQDIASAVADSQVDLAGALEALGVSHPGRVEVVTGGQRVPMVASRTTELVAAVRACLDNVVAHVGDGATTWVLLESDPELVTVSVRDNGPGIPDGRLQQAEQDGRLGVVSSIRGRVEELGGTARVETGDWGTEWVLEVPKR